MIYYSIYLALGLLGIAIVFLGRRFEWAIIIGAGFYGLAIFAAAVHSMHGATP